MRYGFWFIVLSLLSGVAAGWAWTRYELGEPGQLPAHVKRPAGAPSVSEQGLPKAEVLNGTVHEFGVMELGTTRKHEFQVKNTGIQPLTLTIKNTSCRCTLANLPNNQLAPGQQTSIELEWKANDKHGPFSQTATLETNDPLHQYITLGVRGQVVGAYYLEPSELILSKVLSTADTTGEFRLFCYTVDQLPPPDMIKWSPEENAPYLSVEFTPLPAADLQRSDKPRSGYLGRITIKPGLPLGDFRQFLTFRLQTDQELFPRLEISGRVAGSASLLGTEKWDSDHQILDWGKIQKGKQTTSPVVKLILLGDQREAVKPKAQEIKYPWLTVEFGEPEYIAELQQTHVPLKLVVAADAPAIRFTGQGAERFIRVAIDPGLPMQSRLRMFVQVTIE